jgi:hypothetical protein
LHIMRKGYFLFAAVFLLPFALAGCRQEVSALPAAAAETLAPEPPQKPEPPRKPGLLLSFTGDIMAHKNNFTMKDYNDIYADVKDLFTSDDLSFANLEFPVYEDVPMSSFPMFNVHPPYVEAAAAAGLDVFSMANNHTTDKGPHGVIATFNVMEELADERGIVFSGIRKDTEQPFQPVVIEKKGWRIGFIAVTQWLNTYWGGDHAHYLHYEEEEAKKAFFSLLDEHTPGCDIFILSFHGGVEYATLASQEKIQFFDECLNHGVDIIWAHHPHVLQPWYLDRNTEGGKLIIYSAGNVISGQTWFLDGKNSDHPRTYTGDGAVFQVRIQDTGETYKIRGVTPVLISNYKDPEKGMVCKKLAALPGDSAISTVWRNFYKRRLTVISSHIADYSTPNILP